MAGSGPDGWALLSMGTTTAALLVVPMGLGWLLDSSMGTLPLFVLIGLALGIAACGQYVYTTARRNIRS